MKTFYRYVRQLKFNDARMELETLSHGGVCLRFQEIGGGDLCFTHARCAVDELFSKAVAKRIADQRYAEASNLKMFNGPIDFTEETDVLVEMVIAFSDAYASAAAADEDKPSPIQLYLAQELRALARNLRQLVSSNVRESHKADVWKAGMAAANFKSGYENLSR